MTFISGNISCKLFIKTCTSYNIWYPVCKCRWTAAGVFTLWCTLWKNTIGGKIISKEYFRDRRGIDCMVVEFTSTYAISAHHHQRCDLESHSWWGVLDTTLSDKICQWLATGLWFSLGTLVFSTNKTDRHDITEILFSVLASPFLQGAAPALVRVTPCPFSLFVAAPCPLWLTWMSFS